MFAYKCIAMIDNQTEQLFIKQIKYFLKGFQVMITSTTFILKIGKAI